VEVGDATEKKELPFVAGIMADLSGDPEEPLARVKDRKFVEIDRDNFNEVLDSCKPRIEFNVENTLTGDGKMNVELNFSHMDDFTPTKIIDQVEPLRKLLEARVRLKDLTSKLDGNDDLDSLLQQVINNTEDQTQLKEQLGGTDG
jgi:type VI secretion system protein ImpB